MVKKIAAAVVVLGLIAGGAFWATSGPQTTVAQPLGAADAQTAETAPAEAAPAEAAPTTTATEIDPAMLADRTMGNPDAPVKLTEYASFTCPHCAAFNEEVFQDLKKNYIDTGKVFFTYREVYFDRYGLWAGMIARCGGADRYFGFVETYYSTRDTWLNSDDPAVIAANLKRIGRTGGMTDAALDTCLNNTAFAEALVANFQKTSTEDNVEGTPTFIINGEKFSNMAYDEFAKVLDAKLAE